MIQVLLIEDTAVIREVVSTILQHQNRDLLITAATNGETGIEAALQNDYDVILMDLRMPGIDGFEATQQIKGFSPNTPIIAFTAFSDKRTRRKAEAAGVDALFVKPSDGGWVKLAALIRKWTRPKKVLSQAESDELKALYLKLSILKEQRAKYGIDTPVHILIGIEDTEIEIAEIEGIND